jgi:hypothetical protein
MAGWEAAETVGAIKTVMDAKARPLPPPVPAGRKLPPPPPGASIIPNPPAHDPAAGAPAAHSGGGSAPGAASAGWKEKLTADKVPYYFHTSTDAVSWDKPDCLKTAEELERDQGEWVWVTDDKEVWVPAQIKKRSGSSVTVSLENGSSRTVTAGPKEPLWPLVRSSLNRQVDDMVMVEGLNHAQMMYLLKSRYMKDDIYTWVGASHTVLVSVNPFKQLPIYTVNVMAQFSKSSMNRLDSPHTFAIAASAFRNMQVNEKNQAILISGESGSGKTEATKQCFNFLAEIAGSELQLEQKILQSNPVLEAFGNAKTIRNNNSSRFGRWTEINFSHRGQIIGASIENYLLEKSRVVEVGKDERNYHIFYQLCYNMSKQLNLPSPDSFRYLSGAGAAVTAEGIDDNEDFSAVREAFAKLDFSDADVDWVFETCAGILHLGNVKFSSIQDGEATEVDVSKSGDALQTASRFFRLSEKELGDALCAHSIEVRGEVNFIRHKPREAQEATDTLAKAIYNSLFNWLVKKINKSVQGSKGSFIGVLDIFGFEIFDKNGFEQLCINFTNEKLQQHFNSHTFKEEERTYLSEEVPYEPVLFIDNQPVLDLLEKKPYGLLNLLDEEVRLPKGEDSKWLAKCTTNHAANNNFTGASKLGQHSKTSFQIMHYAGSVVYDALHFCDKNKDNLHRNMYDLMSKTSGHANMKVIFPERDNNPKTFESLCGFFRKQLTNLMGVCDTTEPHYIRCIKPNQDKRSQLFKSQLCLDQLTYAGVFEAVQIRKNGYPFRLPHSRFAARYYPMLKHKGQKLPLKSTNSLETCRQILGSVNQDFSRVAIGNTMILYRAEEYRILELLRNLCLDAIMPCAQRQGRRKIGWRFLAGVKEITKICKPALDDGNDPEWLDEVVEKSQKLIAPFKTIFYNFEPHILENCRNRRKKLEDRVRLNKEMRRIIDLKPGDHYEAFVAAVQLADKTVDMPGSAADAELERRIRDLLAGAAGEKIGPWAQDILFILDKSQMLLCIGEAEKVGFTNSDVEEIREALTWGEEKFVRMQLKRANEIGDKDRVMNREIRLKDIYLDMYGAQHEFGHSCPLLRDASAWVSAKFLAIFRDQEKFMQGFLKHTTSPIHLSLTLLQSPSEAKDALKAFKNLMGFMGDRKYNCKCTSYIVHRTSGMKKD